MFRARWFLFGLLATDVLLGWSYVFRTSFLLGGRRVYSLWDDAMISMAYAKNLAAGHGLVWFPGADPVQGFSNLGVCLTMAAAHLLPVDGFHMPLVVQLAGILTLAGILLSVWSISADVSGGSRVPAGTTLAVALSAPLHIWTLQGSDVGFVALWWLASVRTLQSVHAGRRAPAWFVAVLVGGTVLRPESLLLCLPLLAVAAHARAIPTRQVVAAGAGILAVAAAWVGLGLAYYGDPLPNTFYLKLTGAPRLLAVASSFGQFAWWPGLFVGLGLAAVAAVAKRDDLTVRATLAAVVPSLALNAWLGGDWKFGYGSRFVASVIPLILILAGVGLAALTESLRPRLRPAVHTALLLVLGLVLNPARAAVEWFHPTSETMHRADNRKNLHDALYFRDHTAPGTSIALHWGGVASYHADRCYVDVLGKSDRHVARVATPLIFPGHSKWDWDYVVDVARPDIIRVATRGLERHRGFRSCYCLAESPAAPPFWVRRESLDRLRDPDLRVHDCEG